MPNKTFGKQWLDRSYQDLLEILAKLGDKITVTEDEKDLLIKASVYYTENRYPGVFYTYPSEEEIKLILSFSRNLYNKISHLLEV